MKWAAIWLTVLTILYVVHLVADLVQGARVRRLEARLAALEGGKREGA